MNQSLGNSLSFVFSYATSVPGIRPHDDNSGHPLVASAMLPAVQVLVGIWLFAMRDANS
jgi:hypothetical protein